MARRWLRRSRGRDDDALQSARAQLTEMFLVMETRQADTDTAVGSAVRLFSDSVIATEWAPVRDVCYAATDAYLAVIGGSDAAAGARPSRAALDDARQRLDGAIRYIDAFRDRHRARLDAAAHTSQSIVTGAQRALSSLESARRKLAEADPVYRAYPSVQRGAEGLDAAEVTLYTATQRNDLRAVEEAMEAVATAVAVADEALAAAPGREEQATRVVASVRTRLEAVRNRSAAVPEQYSALLREFSATSSADLSDNVRTAGEHLDRAERSIREAVLAKTEKRPDEAIAAATEARSELADAEKLVNAVPERLALLRGLRDDPTAPEKKVRFRLRDAQRLVVDRDLISEWGSVLDAQVDRIDRIVAGLTGRHPDYWRYHQDLEQVTAFIGTIVERVRQRAVK